MMNLEPLGENNCSLSYKMFYLVDQEKQMSPYLLTRSGEGLLAT